MAMKSQTQRTLLFCFLGSIALCGLMGIYVLTVGNLGSFQGRVMATTFAFAVAALFTMGSAVAWERKRWQPLGPIAVLVTGLTLVIVLGAIWFDMGSIYMDDLYYRIMGIGCVASTYLTLISLVALARLRKSYESIRICTILTGGTVSMMLIAMLIEGDAWQEEWVFRFLGVLSILTVCGMLAMPLLHRISAIRTREEVVTAQLMLTLICPRCNKQQQLSTGRSSCGDCGLKFIIEIEEEHCATCGYPLYRLESSVCPECGTPLVAGTATHPSVETRA